MPKKISPITPDRHNSRTSQWRCIQIIESLVKDCPPAEYTGNTEDWRPNATFFSKAFKCSRRTILRDIDYLNSIGCQIEYDSASYSFILYNRDAMQKLPLMQVSEDELLALLTSLAISRSVLDGATAAHLGSFLKKLEENLADKWIHTLEAVCSSLSYIPSHNAGTESHTWTFLQKSILDEKGVIFEYMSPRTYSSAPARKVDPLHLAWIKNTWYLMARNKGLTKDNDIRHYRLSRIQKLRHGNWRSSLNFDREKLMLKLRSGTDAWHGEELETVRLRIDPNVSTFIREYNWPQGHQFIQQSDEHEILELQTSSPDKLDHFILEWSPYIEVLEPKYLRADIASKAREMANLHQDSPKPTTTPRRSK